MASAAANNFKIFYMNQGGKGNWGAIRYSEYDLLCLAEWRDAKANFKVAWSSKDSVPSMSIQVPEHSGREIVGPKDSDLTAQTVRPIVSFTVKGQAFRVIFVHLKSGDASQANAALKASVANLATLQIPNATPILWIGDFNRADSLSNFFESAKCIVSGGGEAKWPLDRVYTTGTWPATMTVQAEQVSRAGDNGHAGYAITVSTRRH